MRCIVHVIKKHEILPQSVKNIHKLFHRLRSAARQRVKNLHFFWCNEKVFKEQFARMCCSKKRKQKERGPLRLVSSTKRG